MNDAPDSEAQRLVSRRTVAKTAAWAAPAIALAAASPAHAASPSKDVGGVILFEESAYTLETSSAYVGWVKGTLTPNPGGEVPADLVLTAQVTDSFHVLMEPVINEDRRSFEFLVHGDPGEPWSGTLTVSAAGYPSWGFAETVLEKEVPVALPPGTPVMTFDEYTFIGSPGGTMTITGKITVPDGTVLPEGIQLMAFPDVEGWVIVGGVTLVDGIFSFQVKQTNLARHFGHFSIWWMLPDPGDEYPRPFARCYTWDGRLYR